MVVNNYKIFFDSICQILLNKFFINTNLIDFKNLKNYIPIKQKN